MVNTEQPVTPEGLTFGDLKNLFMERYPDISEEKLAAVIAQFIEEIPFAATITDDGLLVAMPDGRLKMPVAVARVIDELKAFAGDAYPFFDRRLSS